jgi:polysaccharide export outer membrane protein
VRIEVFQEADLTTEARLDENGAVRIPLLEAVRLAGLTIPDAQAVIEKALADAELIRRAHVTVRIMAYAPREVMITGQVRAPGSYPLPAEGGMTLIDLISRAGGLTELARGSATRTRIEASGEKHTLTIDAASLLRGKGNAKSPDLVLQAGDIVFVPERIF